MVWMVSDAYMIALSELYCGFVRMRSPVDEPWVASWCGLLNQTRERSSGRRDEDNQRITPLA